MGKIAGWTKIMDEPNLWEQVYSLQEWINDRTMQRLGYLREGKHWRVYITDRFNPGITISLQNTRTEEQAMNFAIAYMKSHPRG